MILTEVAHNILGAIAEAYPTSAHYRGGRRLRLGGWERRFPAIADDVDQKEAFLEAVEDLVGEGVVAVKWRRFRAGEEVEALYLEDPKALYELLGRTAPWDRRDELLRVLDNEPWTFQRLWPLAEGIRVRLEAHHPVGVEDPDELRDLGKLFALTTKECEGFPIRGLSVRLYNDSKRLEGLLPAADRLSSEATGERLSRILGLSRSYPEVSFCLFGTLRVSGRLWTLDGEVVTLPGDTVAAVEAAELRVPATTGSPWVLTVENKESFFAVSAAARNAWRAEPGGENNPPSALVYTGGHPGDVVTALLSRLGEGAGAIMHFGDMDPEGLLILQELAERTGEPVHPFAMDVETFRRYAPFGRPFSEVSLRRLYQVRHPELAGLARLIRESGIGVEQEVVPVEFGD